MSKILVSGLQPTGLVHIGNYFGAMKQFVDLQDQFESRIFLADLHALTFIQDASDLMKNSLELALDFLAIGIDPSKTILYKQSDIPEVAELAWIFNCLTTMPYLMRAHAFKDAEAKNKEINVGKFDYPILMAADILIQEAEVVPVGGDQKQHLEIARDTAEKFNRVYGETFKLPEAHIMDEVATVPGLDGQKMSKSYGNTIPLFASEEEINDLVSRIVTDSGSDIPKNVYALHALIKDGSELKDLYESKRGKYQELKKALAKDLNEFLSPLHERRNELAKDPDYVLGVLETGKEKVREVAEKKMQEVRRRVGLVLK